LASNSRRRNCLSAPGHRCLEVCLAQTPRIDTFWRRPQVSHWFIASSSATNRNLHQSGFSLRASSTVMRRRSLAEGASSSHCRRVSQITRSASTDCLTVCSAVNPPFISKLANNETRLPVLPLHRFSPNLSFPLSTDDKRICCLWMPRSLQARDTFRSLRSSTAQSALTESNKRKIASRACCSVSDQGG